MGGTGEGVRSSLGSCMPGKNRFLPNKNRFFHVSEGRFYMMEKCRGVRCTAPHDTTALAATRERRRMQPQELRGRCQLAPMGWECTRAACIGNHNTEELTEMALPGDRRCDTCCQIHLPWTVQTDICRHCNKVMTEEPTRKKEERWRKQKPQENEHP